MEPTKEQLAERQKLLDRAEALYKIKKLPPEDSLVEATRRVEAGEANGKDDPDFEAVFYPDSDGAYLLLDKIKDVNKRRELGSRARAVQVGWEQVASDFLSMVDDVFGDKNLNNKKALIEREKAKGEHRRAEGVRTRHATAVDEEVARARMILEKGAGELSDETKAKINIAVGKIKKPLEGGRRRKTRKTRKTRKGGKTRRV